MFFRFFFAYEISLISPAHSCRSLLGIFHKWIRDLWKVCSIRWPLLPFIRRRLSYRRLWNSLQKLWFNQNLKSTSKLFKFKHSLRFTPTHVPFFSASQKFHVKIAWFFQYGFFVQICSFMTFLFDINNMNMFFK